jgi:hypothetical protein
MQISLVYKSVFFTLVFDVVQTDCSITISCIKDLAKHFEMRELLKHFL